MDPKHLVGQQVVGKRGGQEMTGKVMKYLVDRELYEVHFEDGSLWMLDGEFVEQHIPKISKVDDNDNGSDGDENGEGTMDLVKGENDGFAAANCACCGCSTQYSVCS